MNGGHWEGGRGEREGGEGEREGGKAFSIDEGKINVTLNFHNTYRSSMSLLN